MAKTKTNRSIFDSILNVFAWLSFFVAVILAIAVFFSSFSGTDNGRSIFGYKMLIVQSDSMTKPEESQNEDVFFSAGDLIFIREVSNTSEIAVGDVITFISYNPDSLGKTLSHKVRSILKNDSGKILGFETYGIKTGESDGAIVDPNTVIGKYAGKSVVLGRLFSYFKTPAGYFTSILIPCVLLIIFFSIKVGKLLANRALHRIYYREFELLRQRIDGLENRNGGNIMQTNLQTAGMTNAETSESIQQAQAEQVVSANGQQVFSAQPIVQMQSSSDKMLEIMANTLSNTINSLTRTIDTLATAVGKPVDTLARSVETLAMAATKPTMVEKVVEKPVVQTIIKDAPIVPQQKIIVDEIATTETPVQYVAPTHSEVIVEDVAPTQSEVVEAQEEPLKETATSDPFSEFKQHEKVPFNKKLLSLTSDIKNFFSDVHNELVSYKKVHYRVSFKGVSYRVGRKTIAKMVVRGKTLKLHLALDVNDYSKTVFFQQDMSSVKAYEDVPFTVKIKSERGKNNAINLVISLAEKNSLVKNDKFNKEDILKLLRLYK